MGRWVNGNAIKRGAESWDTTQRKSSVMGKRKILRVMKREGDIREREFCQSNVRIFCQNIVIVPMKRVPVREGFVKKFCQ